jgi:hypothetical protein
MTDSTNLCGDHLTGGPGCQHQDPPRRFDVEQDALPGM